MSSDLGLIETVERRLRDEFGEIELVSALYAFDFTPYYQPEMGPDQQKKFLSFTPLIEIERLPAIKHRTNAIEQEYARASKRRINIDPGYVTHAQLILATTKDYTHRIYLGQGIYADLSYVCRRAGFQPLEWTYPDYRQPLALDFFQRVRETYLQAMRAWQASQGRESA